MKHNIASLVDMLKEYVGLWNTPVRFFIDGEEVSISRVTRGKIWSHYLGEVEIHLEKDGPES